MTYTGRQKVLCDEPVINAENIRGVLSGALIKAYESATDAARKNGFSQPGISRCCTGERKTYKGFVWKYAQEVSDGTGT